MSSIVDYAFISISVMTLVWVCGWITAGVFLDHRTSYRDGLRHEGFVAGATSMDREWRLAAVEHGFATDDEHGFQWVENTEGSDE